jgi:HK97 gp10 family phage protein
MAIPRVKISGLQHVKKALSELAPKVEKKVIRDAIRTAAKPILAEIKNLVPVGETGDLKKSLKIRVVKKKKKGTIAFLIGSSAKGFRNSEQYYGAFLELGTRKQKPLGFIRKAYDEKGKEAADEAMRLILEGLNRIVTSGQ